MGYARLHAGPVLESIGDDKPIELSRLYVSNDWIGRGVGEASMRGYLDAMRNEGYQTLWLGVWEHNCRARAFYRKWEFREVGEQIFQLGTAQQTDVVMERSV